MLRVKGEDNQCGGVTDRDDYGSVEKERSFTTSLGVQPSCPKRGWRRHKVQNY